jgi:hypothetical protein
MLKVGMVDADGCVLVRLNPLTVYVPEESNVLQDDGGWLTTNVEDFVPVAPPGQCSCCGVPFQPDGSMVHEAECLLPSAAQGPPKRLQMQPAPILTRADLTALVTTAMIRETERCLNIVNHARLEGETDLRQVRDWIKSMKDVATLRAENEQL